MYKKKLWTMRQYAGFTSAKESNKRFRYLLEQGVTGLSIAFDLPTQIGYDSDHEMAKGEIGRVGVPISTIKNMERVLSGISLDQVSTSMTINATAAVLLAFYIAVAELRGIPANKLRGTIQNDILKEYIARGTYIYPPEPSLRLVTDIFEFCSENIPNWNTISISGYHIREAGSTAPQELAFTISNGIAYVQSAVNRGLDINVFGARLSFFLNAHNDFLTEIAKFRAARRIWAKIMRERFNVTNEKALLCRFHVQTGGSTLTAQQIDNNVVRTTIQALSAILGGTQSLHTNSKDEALSLPTDETVKLALRTQQIIASESGIADYVDPLGGSYVIEALTDQLEEEAFAIIRKIDERGGAVATIESGWVQNEIAQSAYEYQKSVDSNKTAIIGVNQHVSKEKSKLKLLDIDQGSVSQQLEELKRFKANRNNVTVNTKLDQLRSAARGTENLIPYILDCVKNDCSLGEISDVLRDIFGVYIQN
jgi:methylmalonyl-CoA mutase N-terminal domain/subunit